MPAGTLQEKYKTVHLLQNGLIWHYFCQLVNLLQNLLSGTKKHLHASPLSGRSALAEVGEF